MPERGQEYIWNNSGEIFPNLVKAINLKIRGSQLNSSKINTKNIIKQNQIVEKNKKKTLKTREKEAHYI